MMKFQLSLLVFVGIVALTTAAPSGTRGKRSPQLPPGMPAPPMPPGFPSPPMLEGAPEMAMQMTRFARSASPQDDGDLPDGPPKRVARSPQEPPQEAPEVPAKRVARSPQDAPEEVPKRVARSPQDAPEGVPKRVAREAYEAGMPTHIRQEAIYSSITSISRKKRATNGKSSKKNHG